MKNIFFTVLCFILINNVLTAQNLTFETGASVPICTQFTVAGFLTITDPNQLSGSTFNLIINNSVNKAQPPIGTNPPIPGGGQNLTSPDLPPCVDGGPNGTIHPIRYE
ncbi:MAG: hypothetical protein ACR2GN_09315, partial [Bacteroidia bacterium]